MSGIVRLNKSSIKFYKEVNQDYSTHEDFTQLIQEGDGKNKLSEKENSIVKGVITSINKDYVLFDVGLKSEGKVPLKEFISKKGHPPDLSVGDVINLHLTKLEGRDGGVVLSRESAIKYELWDDLNDAHKDDKDVEGTITHKIRSGYIVDLGLIAAFLPNSHVDLKPVKDATHLLNKKIKFRILKMDKEQGNIVVSRRIILDSLHAQARSEFLSTLKEGQVLEGVVKSITNYGVFFGLYNSPKFGSIDGLMHRTDMSWSRVTHPSEIYSCGQKVDVKIINIDKELNRISLGRKQLTDNPWNDSDKRYPAGKVVDGVVTSIEEYGIFVEVEPGIEGLVYSQEISWTNEKLPIAIGDKVKTMILSVDAGKNRMSLSIKQCHKNPWVNFAHKFPLGSILKCEIKNININSGINVGFVDYDDEVWGFIHNRDLSWENDRSRVSRDYKIGDTINAKLLRVNSFRGGIFLGIKQIKYDPFVEFIRTIKEDSELRCVITKIEDNGIYVKVRENIDRFVERDFLLDMSSLSVGENVTLRVEEVGDYDLLLTNKPKSYFEKDNNKIDE